MDGTARFAFPPFRVENIPPPPIRLELVRIFLGGSFPVGDARDSSHEEDQQDAGDDAAGARLPLLRITDDGHRRPQGSRRIVRRDSKCGVNSDVIPLAVGVRVHEHALRCFLMLAFAEWAPIDRPADLVHRSSGELTVFALVSIRAAAAMMSVARNVSEKKRWRCSM